MDRDDVGPECLPDGTLEGDVGTGQFSTIFQRLVSEPDDLIGLVAYGIYKQSKRDWIIRYRSKYKKKPDETELQRYHDHFSDDELQRYRKQAEAMLYNFAEVYVEDRTPDIVEQVRTTEFRETGDRINKSLTGITEKIDSSETSIKRHVSSKTHPLWSVVWNVIAWVFTVVVTVAVAGALLLPNLIDRLAERLVLEQRSEQTE